MLRAAALMLFLDRRDRSRHVDNAECDTADEEPLPCLHVHAPFPLRYVLPQGVAAIAAIAPAGDWVSERGTSHPRFCTLIVLLPFVKDRSRELRRREHGCVDEHALAGRAMKYRVVPQVRLVPTPRLGFKDVCVRGLVDAVVYTGFLERKRQRRNRAREIEQIENGENRSDALDDSRAMRTHVLRHEECERAHEDRHDDECEAPAYEEDQGADATEDDRHVEDKEREEHSKKDTDLEREPRVGAGEALVPQEESGEKHDEHPARGERCTPAVKTYIRTEETAERELRHDGQERGRFHEERLLQASRRDQIYEHDPGRRDGEIKEEKEIARPEVDALEEDEIIRHEAGDESERRDVPPVPASEFFSVFRQIFSHEYINCSGSVAASRRYHAGDSRVARVRRIGTTSD